MRVANNKLQETVKSDFLTSLVNRRYFEMDLSDVLLHKKEDLDHVSILLFDIDNFKVINDKYGHAAGDEVLTQVARKVEQFMRSGDVVARYASRTGFDLSNIRFYEALALYRIAVIIEQIYARYAAGQTADKRFARFEPLAPILAGAAREILET